MPEQKWQRRIEQALADTYTAEGVHMWLWSRNRMLDLRVPQDMIDAGEGEKVYALAYSPRRNGSDVKSLPSYEAAVSGRLSRVGAPDPAAVMAEHETHCADPECCVPDMSSHEIIEGRCLPYRLAEALAAEPDRTRAAVVTALRNVASGSAEGTSSNHIRRFADVIENGADW